MARPIEHVTVIRVKDPEKTYREWLEPPKRDPEREKLLREAEAYAKKHPIKARHRRSS